MVKILDGKRVADEIEAQERQRVQGLKAKGVIPSLAIILVGNNEASKIYVSKKKKIGEKIGIKVEVFSFLANATTEDILDKIDKLNKNTKIHGIIVQFPLPKNIDKLKLIESIFPDKDVDGAHPLNWGRLAYATNKVVPCTAAAAMKILHFYKIPIENKEVVLVGKSELVGKPLGIMLMNENATLTIVHKGTKDLKKHTRWADILISAVGSPGLINKSMIKKGAVLIDIGISKVGKSVVGDVDFKDIKNWAGAVTPVPGGVGPVTVAKLLKNVVNNAITLSA